MAKIFIIEDEHTIKAELIKLLASYGYEAVSSDKFQTIATEVLREKPDLVLLDINLPYFDGYTICREIRKSSTVPVIIVTSRNSELDELMSMNLGADDFITKPYNTQILLARIASVLRRTDAHKVTPLLSWGGVALDLAEGIACHAGQAIELTKNELRILSTLMRMEGGMVTRDDLMNALWQSDEFVDDNTLTVNINRLRKKLEEIGVRNYLLTKRGQGYKL